MSPAARPSVTWVAVVQAAKQATPVRGFADHLEKAVAAGGYG